MNNLLKLGDLSPMKGELCNMKNRVCQLEIVLAYGLLQVTVFGL